MSQLTDQECGEIAMKLVKNFTPSLTAWEIIQLGEMINLRCGWDKEMLERLDAAYRS